MAPRSILGGLAHMFLCVFIVAAFVAHYLAVFCSKCLVAPHDNSENFNAIMLCSGSRRALAAFHKSSGGSPSMFSLKWMPSYCQIIDITSLFEPNVWRITTLGRGAPLSTSAAARLPTNASSSAPKAKQVTVKAFGSLLPYVKRFILRVHPDVVHSAGPEVIAVNEGSIREFFRLFDTLKQRCGEEDGTGADAPVAGQRGAAALKHRFDFSFYYRPPTASALSSPDSGSSNELKRANVDIAIPPLFQERMTLLEQKGLAAQARSHWLSLAATAAGKLLASVGVDVSFQLSPEHQQVVDKANEQAKARSDARERARGGGLTGDESSGAMGALRRNLLDHSPLVQGKGRSFPHMSAASKESVYTLKERSARALRLLSEGGRISPAPSLTSEQVRRGHNALRHAMIEYHDALQLYHPLWPAIALTIGPTGSWLAQPSARSLQVPWDFTPPELVQFVRAQLPPLISFARKGVASKAASMNAERKRAASTFSATSHGDKNRGGGGASQGAREPATSKPFSHSGEQQYGMHHSAEG